MPSLLDKPIFRADYERLRQVKLNPARHTAATAYEHCELVAARVAHLAALNGCTPAETQVLQDLAYAHDIGKMCGTANPEKSVALLPRYGIVDGAIVELVRYHDINLPWFLSCERGRPPSDKAWRKMASKVNVRLLCLFMVADRVDCPGSWRTNRPLVWFLQEVKNRGFLTTELHLDDGSIGKQVEGPILERSAGAALVHGSSPDIELLVVKIRSTGYELPKGHLEWNETPEQAAVRELREETGLVSEANAGELLGILEYVFEKDGTTIQKSVRYYLATIGSEVPCFGPKPSGTNELRWIREVEVSDMPLVSEELRAILLSAFRRASAGQ